MSNVRKLEPVMKSVEPVEVEKKEEVVAETFEEITRKNKENAERIARERAKANKGVLKSYRIKTP